MERGKRENFPGSKLPQCISVCCCVGNWWELVCTSLVALGVSGNKLLLFSAKETQLSHIQKNLSLLGWLLSPILIVIIIVALQKVPEFLGYRAIFHQLRLRPSFWTLVLLLAIALWRYGMELVMAPKSLLPLSIIIGFALCYILTVVLACVLNCTQLNFLKRQYPRFVFVLSKLALLVIFLVNITNFIISLLAVSRVSPRFIRR